MEERQKEIKPVLCDRKRMKWHGAVCVCVCLICAPVQTNVFVYVCICHVGGDINLFTESSFKDFTSGTKCLHNANRHV